jgi:CheY-like chemotaxis protein
MLELMTKKILVVDDDPMYIDLISNLVSPRNATMISAPHGAAAFKALESQTVDLIMSDFNMPVMDGIMFHKKVSGDSRFNKIPFVFITGTVEPALLSYTGQHPDLTIIRKTELVDKLIGFVDKWVP